MTVYKYNKYIYVYLKVVHVQTNLFDNLLATPLIAMSKKHRGREAGNMIGKYMIGKDPSV